MGIVRIRRAPEGSPHRYIACDNEGLPIRGYQKLSEIREWYKLIDSSGTVRLVRELDQEPACRDIEWIRKLFGESEEGDQKAKPDPEKQDDPKG